MMRWDIVRTCGMLAHPRGNGEVMSRLILGTPGTEKQVLLVARFYLLDFSNGKYRPAF